MNIALEALYAAAKAIRELGTDLITECSVDWVDNDRKSGEIIFTVAGGDSYILKLEPFHDPDCTPVEFVD